MVGPRLPQDNSGEENDLVDFEKDVLDQFGYDEEDKDDDLPEDDLEPDESDDDTDGESDEDDLEKDADSKVEPKAAKEENFKLKQDAKGNLIDGSGKIVAKAGSERRLFEKNQKLQHQFNTLDREFHNHRELMVKAHDEIVRLRTENEYFKNGGMEKELGITPDEKSEALSIYAKLKNNATALDATKYILTKLAQRGINIQSLGVGAGAIDPSVISGDIRSYIDQKLNPITQRLEHDNRTIEARNQAKQVLSNFFNYNPDAKAHSQTLGRMLSDPRFKGMSINEAWSRLQNYLLRQKLEAQQSPQQPEPQMPSGRPRPGAPSGPRSSVDDSPMNADLTYKDIVKSVMADYGGIG